MSGNISPKTGVASGATYNGYTPVNAPVAGCTQTFYPSNNCNVRFDGLAYNALESLIFAAIDDAGLAYDCSNAHQLSLAIKALALAVAPAALGFTPVQQNGGIGQATNKVFVGWSGARLKATVDASDLGNIVFDSQLAAAIAALTTTTSSMVWDGVSQIPVGGYIMGSTLGNNCGVGAMAVLPIYSDGYGGSQTGLVVNYGTWRCLGVGKDNAGNGYLGGRPEALWQRNT